MATVHIVAPEQVHMLWPDVVDFISASAATATGDCTPDQTRMMLAKGIQTMFIAMENEAIIGAMVVELSTQPNRRAMVITALGGRGIVDMDLFSQVEQWGRANGATTAVAWACDAQARLYKQKAGFDTVRHIVEKQL